MGRGLPAQPIGHPLGKDDGRVRLVRTDVMHEGLGTRLDHRGVHVVQAIENDG